jgi:Putative lumazine-binding
MEVVDTTQREIVATALDYFEGWFDGDVARMRRALHPQLAKRSLIEDGGTLNETTTDWMVDATAKNLGKAQDVPDRLIEVEVVDVYARKPAVCNRETASGLRDHEHDGHDGNRDAADGEQRDGAEPQRYVATGSQRMLQLALA